MAAEQNIVDVKGMLTKIAPRAHKLGLAGLAELVHNAADADAQRLDIQLEHATKAGWVVGWSARSYFTARREFGRCLAGTREKMRIA